MLAVEFLVVLPEPLVLDVFGAQWPGGEARQAAWVKL
jgi:hypothetical protein